MHTEVRDCQYMGHKAKTLVHSILKSAALNTQNELGVLWKLMLIKMNVDNVDLTRMVPIIVFIPIPKTRNLDKTFQISAHCFTAVYVLLALSLKLK